MSLKQFYILFWAEFVNTDTTYVFGRIQSSPASQWRSLPQERIEFARIPVSYTHLDVYKRQSLNDVMLVFMNQDALYTSPNALLQGSEMYIRNEVTKFDEIKDSLYESAVLKISKEQMCIRDRKTS